MARDPIPREPDSTQDVDTVTITSATTVWDPGSLQLRFMGGDISVSVDGSVLFTEETSGTILYRTPNLVANVPYSFDVCYSQGALLAAGKELKAILSAAGAIKGTLKGELLKP